jgi:hypothetical protein
MRPLAMFATPSLGLAVVPLALLAMLGTAEPRQRDPESPPIGSLPRRRSRWSGAGGPERGAWRRLGRRRSVLDERDVLHGRMVTAAVTLAIARWPPLTPGAVPRDGHVTY